MKGKRIIVGITGGIAAYKVATVVREMKRRGAEVRVVMTPMAKQFITPLTMATLSQNPISVDFFDPENGILFFCGFLSVLYFGYFYSVYL